MEPNLTRHSDRSREGRRGKDGEGESVQVTHRQSWHVLKTNYFAAAVRPRMSDLIRESTLTHVTRRCACPCLSACTCECAALRPLCNGPRCTFKLVYISRCVEHTSKWRQPEEKSTSVWIYDPVWLQLWRYWCRNVLVPQNWCFPVTREPTNTRFFFKGSHFCASVSLVIGSYATHRGSVPGLFLELSQPETPLLSRSFVPWPL